MTTYFFTGFPGFITTHLLKRLLHSTHQVDQVYLLVLPEVIPQAEKIVTNIIAEVDQIDDRISIIPGDITHPNLGLSEENLSRLKDQVEVVFHLAAIYDLAVPETLAHQVNVIGTKQVNEWVQSLKNLKRYIYFSTAYVSGTRVGNIYEHELVMGQTFKNHYERTKYEAEVLVQSILDQVPTTIIRPGIVKGDSKTGATTKFDGPYFMLNLFDRLKVSPIIPYPGKGAALGNFVPVDYILDATLYLGLNDVGVGKTYHLTDPQPYSMRQVYQMLLQAYLNRKPIGTVPLSFIQALFSVPFLRKWLKVEKEALDYFNCNACYDSTQAQQDLKGSGITLPDFKNTVQTMVNFYREHKNDPSKHIIIR